jgi:hypothetical protein
LCLAGRLEDGAVFVRNAKVSQDEASEDFDTDFFKGIYGEPEGTAQVTFQPVCGTGTVATMNTGIPGFGTNASACAKRLGSVSFCSRGAA